MTGLYQVDQQRLFWTCILVFPNLTPVSPFRCDNQPIHLFRYFCRWEPITFTVIAIVIALIVILLVLCCCCPCCSCFLDCLCCCCRKRDWIKETKPTEWRLFIPVSTQTQRHEKIRDLSSFQFWHFTINFLQLFGSGNANPCIAYVIYGFIEWIQCFWPSWNESKLSRTQRIV